MRYIGNKTKLLNELDNFIRENIPYKKGMKFCDLFSGTCTVGDYFKDRYEVIANDTLYNYLEAFTSTFIMNKIYRYDIHGKNTLKTLNKY